MRKILIIICLFLMPVIIHAESSECYIVMDAKTNRVLDGKNINKEKLIASTTKIMTAIIIIENTNLNTEVSVGEEVLKSYGSSMYLSPGEKIKIIDLLYGLMLRSGNDAALVLANYYGRDMEHFSTIMNNYAKKLGMNNTHFINSSGLENDAGVGNTSTVYDMGLLMSYAIKNPIFLEIAGTKYHKFSSNQKTYTLKNKNKLLFSDKRVIGGKTGYTKKAKRTLVTAASDNDETLIIVTFNDGNDFNDHKSLYNQNFKKYKIKNVCDKVSTIKDPFNLYSGFRFDYNNDCGVLLTDEEYEQVKVNPILFNGINKKVGKVIGVINFELNNEVIYQNKIKLRKKSLIETLKEWFFD